MSNGKGDSPRNCFSPAFRKNYEDIFRKKRTKPETKRDRQASKAALKAQYSNEKESLD